MRPPRPGLAAGQESVWDYPRPPRVELFSGRIRVVLAGVTVAESERALRVLETSHPPNYYIPPEDVVVGCLSDGVGSTLCEWKGRAVYHDVTAGGRRVSRGAWSYPEPNRAFQAIRGHLAFYASRMDACYVDDELVVPQPGNFYGGWITRRIVGPFKGVPGRERW